MLPYEIKEMIFIYLPFEKVFELEPQSKIIAKKLYNPVEHFWEKFNHKGDLSLLKFLTENNAKICTTQAMSHAAHYGYFEIIKWLHENRSNGCIDCSQVRWPETSGFLKRANWYHVNCSGSCKTNAMDFAASKGRLDIVKYLHKNGYKCTQNALDYAANNGHFAVVEWLHENRTEGCSKNAMDWATKRSHHDIVDFLKKWYPVVKKSKFKKSIEKFRKFICYGY